PVRSQRRHRDPHAHQVARALRLAGRNRRCLQGRGSGHFRNCHQGHLSMFDFFRSAADNFGTSHFWQLSFLIWVLIALALTFDFLNGLHDAANSIATVVSTRVLSPRTAVIWAAFFNFVAFLVFPLNVAATITKDVVDQNLFANLGEAQLLIAATLLAACGWNLFTWWLGLPTSSSHALIGGMVG